MQHITVPAEDGFELAASLFPADSHRTVVIVQSATAVPRRLYDAFATHLQGTGWTVVTFDYRGTGGSRPERLAGFPATMSDWALRDIPGVHRWVRDELQPERVFVVGHSFGGQLLGLLEHPAWVRAAVTVSSQSGYWGLQGEGERLRTRLAVTLLLPVVSRVLGYFPWSLVGRGEDLPSGVALQWARWCRSPRYVLSDDTLPLDRYAGFTAPILAYSIDDDGWGTARSVDAMMGAYPHVERRHLVPAEHGLERLGHMGYFRSSSAALWDVARQWLADQGSQGWS